ncbi:unnamed protein product [Cylicocyclus nassatus]|uniref:Uncharacterized protein n=1 Tax=Cylicocyclus nassatus TaxID=53992 RepID=A0AA36GH23_CYLNA|nr:unnamed protein product [Cylicocyclus nassatus]
MKNTNINNVEVNNVNRERSKHNLDHDVNTTASLGTIQPLGFMEMFPHDKDIINAVRNNPSLSTVSAGQLDLFPKHSGIAFNASFLWNSGIGWDNNVNVKQVWLPLGNTPKSLVGTGVMWDDVFYGSEDISPSNADFVIETEKYESSEPLNRNYAICFRLSDKDTADDRVSILPLLAWYRAYFRFMALSVSVTGESTYCHQLINWIETNGDSVCDFGLTSSQWAAPKTSTSSAPISIFMRFFVNELMDSFYPTEDYNFVSAHRVDITAPYSSSSDYQAGDGKPDGSYATSYYTPQWLESQIKLGTTGHTLGIDGDGAGNMYDIQTTIFSQGSLVGLQATAKDGGLSANLNVRALMKAFGIDGYDTDEPVDVLGFRSFDLNISEVTSLADTYANSITGRYLG